MSASVDWSLLFQLEAPRLRRFLKRFGPRISPEDIGQDAFARLWATQCEDIASPRAYLAATARNLALNDLRRQRNAATDARADIETIALVDTADPESLLIEAERRAAAAAAIAALDAPLREALLLHLAEGLTQPEVARRLGISRRTVQRHINTALGQLLVALADPDI